MTKSHSKPETILRVRMAAAALRVEIRDLETELRIRSVVLESLSIDDLASREIAKKVEAGREIMEDLWVAKASLESLEEQERKLAADRDFVEATIEIEDVICAGTELYVNFSTPIRNTENGQFDPVAALEALLADSQVCECVA